MINVVFNQFGMLLLFAVVIGYFLIRIRQPLILSFILVGMIAGPQFLGWLTYQSQIEVLASFGVTLLLFIVGLKLDINAIKSFGKVTLAAGLGQIVLTTFAGMVLSLILGMKWSAALFVGITLAFSSTIIIIKMLSDRYEIDSLYGRIAVGILIVQDLAVVLAVIVMSSLHVSAATSASIYQDIFTLLLKGVGFLAMIMLFIQYVAPTLVDQLARSRELLILFALSWAVILAVFSDSLGFGKEIGGFVAGVSLASTRYRETIASRLETVRNLLLLFFFLNLGASLEFSALSSEWIAALVLSVFVVLGKPMIVMGLMGGMNFRARTGFLTGLTMGQLSEFSLILAALGCDLGFIDKHIAGLITFVALVSIALSSYLLTYSSQVYEWIKPVAKLFERSVRRKEETDGLSESEIDVILYGYGRHGEILAKILETYGYKILAIDFDPSKMRPAHQQSPIHIRYGDAEDAEFLKTLPLHRTKWVVSTMPHREANQMLVASLREAHYQGKIALSAHHEGELEWMKKMKVDVIFIPYKDAAMSAAQYLVKHMKGVSFE